MDLLDVNETLSDGDLEEDDPIRRLVEGLNIKTLSTLGSEFSVQVNEEAAFEEQLTYEGPKVFDHLNMACIGVEDNSDNLAPSDSPFGSLALKMVDLTSDGKLKKRIISEGYGEIVPPNALVWFHHNSYVEMREEPFDSSHLRGHSTMIRLQSGKCITGLDIGLATMKRDEKAEFLIHPDYAYGKMGIPPRIPAEAHVLVEVEMKKFVDNALALKMGEYTDEELKSLPFQEVYKGAIALLHEGKHAFSLKKYHHAVQLYRKAVKSLENCDMKCDEHDAKNEVLRLKLYTNLGVSLNKLGTASSHKQAIVACRKALDLNPKEVKALYHSGLAHLQLGGTDEAKKFAMLAKKYAPHDTVISSLLQKIDCAMRKYKTSSIAFAKNALRSIGDKENTPKKTDTSSESQNIDDTHNYESPLNEVTGCNRLKQSSAVKIVELNEEERQALHEEKDEQYLCTDNVFAPESNASLGQEFQLAAIEYIKDFLNDQKDRKLPVPTGLTYEEELFFKKQATLYGLRWEERQEDSGKAIMYILK